MASEHIGMCRWRGASIPFLCDMALSCYVPLFSFSRPSSWHVRSTCPSIIHCHGRIIIASSYALPRLARSAPPHRCIALSYNRFAHVCNKAFDTCQSTQLPLVYIYALALFCVCLRPVAWLTAPSLQRPISDLSRTRRRPAGIPQLLNTF